MNKHTTQSALKLFLLITVALTSSCAPLTAVPSPTATPAPSQTPTATVTPSPTNTPEPIHPEGTLIYSDHETIYSIDMQSQTISSIFTTDGVESILISKKYIYITNSSSISETPQKQEGLRINLDGTSLERFIASTGEHEYQKYEILGFSPDEKHIAFYKAGKVVIVDTETKGIQEINELPSHRFLTAYWSLDSLKLFLIDIQLSEYSIGEHMRLLQYSLVDRKITELLTDFPSVDFKWFIEGKFWSWSPDGQHVLLTPSGTNSVYLFNTEDKSLEPIKVIGNSFNYRWSQDGQWVLFNVTNNRQTSISILNIETGGVAQVSSLTPSNYGYDCDWSPNEKMLLCTTNSYDLYLIDLDKDTSTHIQHVQGLEAYDKVSTFYVWNYQTVWSADSKYFVYLTMSNSDPKDHKQDFILNIQSVNTGERLQIQIPRENEIEKIYWLSS
ncbi:MAG: hypothetical protein ACOY0R_01775 [Chloroflexota bacterium]